MEAQARIRRQTGLAELWLVGRDGWTRILRFHPVLTVSSQGIDLSGDRAEMARPLTPREMWTLGTNIQTLSQLPKEDPIHQLAELAPGPRRQGGHRPTGPGPPSLQVSISKPPRQRALTFPISQATLCSLGALFSLHLPALRPQPGFHGPQDLSSAQAAPQMVSAYADHRNFYMCPRSDALLCHHPILFQIQL